MAKFNLRHKCATDQYCGRTDTPTADELARQRNITFANYPLFSIIVPLYRTPLDYLLDCVGSVLAQSYSNWELILVNGDATEECLNAALKQYSDSNNRIKVLNMTENTGIVGNTNAGIEAATGDFLAFLDHDDKLEPDALFRYALEIDSHPDTDMLYCDEDLFRDDSYFGPLIKPEFNLDLLRSQNYVVHFLCIRRQILLDAGLSPAYVEGAQDFDATFKGAEHARRIARIPHVLYHWRSHAGSISADPESKSYSENSGLLALRDHLARTCPEASAETTSVVNVYKTNYPLPNKAAIFCLILQDGATATTGFAIGKQAAAQLGFVPNTQNLEIATSLEESHFVLITRDCIVAEGAVESMARLCARQDVGAVCCKVITETGEIISAGAKYQFKKPGESPLIKMFNGLDAHNFGYEDRVIKNHDVSVATDAILIKSPIFALIEGLSGAYSNVDYKIADAALKITNLGYHVVYDADAYCCQPNIKSNHTDIKQTNPKFDEFTFIKNWKNRLAPTDKTDNPQFDCTSPYCALKEPQFIKTSIGRIMRKVKGLR
jgi:hypothetical protein